MTFLIIIIILFFAWPYIWPHIRRWLQPYIVRWLQRRADNYFRQSMGMPPRDKGRGQARSGAAYRSHSKQDRASGQRRRRTDEPIIPREYAEDVEFTEVHTYSEEHTIADNGEVRFKRESQVSEAEIIEIKRDK